jgi:chitin disaccharide deacetylase
MIINADDFGYSLEVNKAIVESFKKWYCSSTTIMSNMPGFENACQFAYEQRLQNFIGIHFNLIEGEPVTEGIRKCLRFCSAEGLFNLNKKAHVFHLSPNEVRLLADELRAQVKKCRQNDIPLTHADSHHHAHEEWAIAHVVMQICKEEGIPFVRLARNCGLRGEMHKEIYRHILNYKFKKEGLSRTLYFGSVDDYVCLVEEKGLDERTGSTEVMLHPIYDEHGVLIDRLCNLPLEEIMNMMRQRPELESFSGYRRIR